MASMQKLALNRALSYLEAAGAVYTVEAAGFIYSNDERSTRPRREVVNHGIKKYVEEYINDLQPAQVVCIPFADYTVRNLRSIASMLGGKRFGQGNFVTHLNRKENCVEVMRVI